MLNKTTNRYAFELTDHLGNVRAVVAKNASTSAVDVLSYTDYYPHGGVMPGRNFVSSPSYKLGYQGQEKDAETNFSNFELRQLDARLGRWFNPDPMGQYFSPYLAMGNNPVSGIDPTGGWNKDINYADYMDNGFTTAGEYQNYAQYYDPRMDGERYQGRMDQASNVGPAFERVQSGTHTTVRDPETDIPTYDWVRTAGPLGSSFLGPDPYSVEKFTQTPNPLIISKVHTKPYLMSDWDDYSVVSDGNPENVNQLINGAIGGLNWLIDTWNSAVDATGTETMIKNTVYEIQERNASDYDDANYDRAKTNDDIVGMLYPSYPPIKFANDKALKVTAKVISKTLNKGGNSVFIKKAGKLATRFDLKGKAHNGVSTPHKQLYKYNVNKSTGAANYSRASKNAMPMGWTDMAEVMKHLFGM